MTIVWRVTVTLALVGLIILAKPLAVYACSCRPPAPPLEALANASVVFSGRVTAIDAPADRGGAEPIRATFQVEREWKGHNGPTIAVYTPASSASCGVDFVTKQEYLVYASINDGRLQTNLCGRTTTLALATEDLAALGMGSAPSSSAAGSGAPQTLPTTGASTPWPGLAAVGSVLILLGAVLANRRTVGQVIRRVHPGQNR